MHQMLAHHASGVYAVVLSARALATLLTYKSIKGILVHYHDVYINMKAFQELGAAVATRRQALNLRQNAVAHQAGITPESLSRFERGRASEFGSRKLLAVLAVLGIELEFSEIGQSGSLDELRRERAKS
jgi:HTH-type transcriptional regulator / antitoxin HipB